MKKPLVSVVILTFNRKKELQKNLFNVFSQSYENIEVILIDNNSSDGTSEMVRKNFPDVKIIQMSTNIGAPAYNAGFEAARGEYVFILDDDSYPTKKAIAISVRLIKSDNAAGIVACKIYNSNYNFYETEDYRNKLFSFIGCGALIDKRKLDAVGYYDDNIFLYFNELELTSRFLNKGFKILYSDEAVVVHNQSLTARGNITNPFANRNRYLRSYWSMSYFLLTRFYLKYSFLYLFKWLINRGIIAAKCFYFKEFFKGIFTLFWRISVIANNRKPLNIEVQRYYNFGNIFPWIDRNYFNKN